MSTWREHSNYSPGGLSGNALKRRRRELCRKAGKESGRKRRARAWARRGIKPTPQQTAAPLTYDHHVPSRARFISDYAREFPAPESPQGRAMWEKGRETVWEVLVGSWRLRAARGQFCDDTKLRRQRQLELRGRRRSTRQIQRAMRRIEQLGYAKYHHVRTGRGQLDHLRIEWKLTRRLPVRRGSLNVLHPPGTGNPAKAGVPRRSPAEGVDGDSTRYGSIPPPTAADTAPPDKPAERLSTDDEEIEAVIRFKRLKIDRGWGDPLQLRLEIAALERQLPGHARAPIVSVSSEGFRCST